MLVQNQLVHKFQDCLTIVDVKTVKEMLDRGVLFIDVRSASRYKGGHIPDAINVDVWKNFNTEFVKVAK